MADPNETHRRSPHAEVPSTLPVSPRVPREGRRLLVIAGDKVSSHPVPRQGALEVGRGDDVDLRIDDPSVSRNHATLHFAAGRIEISDAGSSNGTRVRGKRLEPGQRVAVAVGETFEVGTALLMLQDPFGAETSVDDGSSAAEQTTSEERSGADPGDIIVRDRAMESLYQLAERVAGSTINVLLLGETGVGKDVLARKIHAMSPRADKPFIALNCGALAEQLLESELFGHEKGAFTGAVEAKLGLLEAANEGTVFLDEIGEMPMSVQVKLLRVLEERQVRRVGGLRNRAFDIRFIGATNRDLTQALQDGAFRSDLYYRLNGISLVIPPLRKRRGEIEGLARHFVTEASERAGQRKPPTLSAEAIRWLEAQDWPGNIRELQNTIERAVLLCTGDSITLEHLPAGSGMSAMPGARTADVTAAAAPEQDVDPERQRILDALVECAGNQTRAAKLLGISRNTLLARLDQYDIPRPRKK